MSSADLVFGVLVADHLVRPVEHPVAVLVGDAEQVGDDHQGQLGRDVGHEVGPALLDDLVDDGVGGGVDALVELVTTRGVKPLFTSRR